MPPLLASPAASGTSGKVYSLAEAVRRHVRPGSSVFFGGMQHGEASAAIHEIVRQRIGNLTVISALTHSVALLLGEGLIDRLVCAYLIDLYEKESCLAERARRRSRFPQLEEMSHYSLSLALLAGQMGVPFLTTRSQLGSSYPEHNAGLKETTCPFTGEKLMAVRALNPDIGILHTQQCDAHGAAHRWGTLGMDTMGINACHTVIITTEKIVPSEVIHRDPNCTMLPSFRVAAVVEVPWGAYPLHLAGCYGSDLASFSAVCRRETDFQNYVDRYIYGIPDRAEMMMQLAIDRREPGLMKRLRALAQSAALTESGN